MNKPDIYISRLKPVLERFKPYVPGYVFRHLLESKEELPSERRNITVIFADLSGFTAFSEKLDPEKVAAILNAALSKLAQPVIERDGTIDKYIGDALMAVFGAPVSHPDDVKRALEAVIEMREAIREFTPFNFNVCIGVHTGMAIAGNIGNTVRKEYSVIGDTVNIASRLESIAGKGDILVSTEAVQQGGPSFVYGPGRKVRVKGREKPVLVKPLLRRRKNIFFPKHTLKKLFIGRETVIKELTDALAREAIVLITGPAGIGKTALINHIIENVTINRRLLRVAAGQSERDRPLSLVHNIFNSMDKNSNTRNLKVAPTGNQGSRRLQPALNLMCKNKGKVGRIFKIIGDFSLKTVCKELINSLQLRPTALFLEDLHLADEASLSILKQLNELPGFSCIATARSESGQGKILPQAERLSLREFDESTKNEMFRRLLKVKKLPAGSEIIAQRTSGVPLAVEETMRYLAEQGCFYRLRNRSGKISRLKFWPGGLAVQTLPSVIRARLDALSPGARRLISRISIFGISAPYDLATKTFTRKEKSAALAELVKYSIVKREGQNIAFVHDLYRMTAYETQLLSQRRQIHLQLADWFRKRQAPPDILANHYLKGGRALTAFPYLIRAADHALGFYALSTADNYLEQALTIARDRQNKYQEAAILLRRASINLRTSQNEKAGKILSLADKIITKGNWRDLRLLLKQRQATYLKNTGAITHMKRLCNRILREAPVHSNARASALQTLGAQYWRDGRYPRARKMYEQILKMKKIGKKAKFLATCSLVDIYRLMRQFDRAEKLLPFILQDRSTGWPLLHRGRLRFDQGRLTEAFRDFLETLARARKVEDPRLETLALRDLARIEIAQGRTSQGLQYAGLSLQVADRIPAFASRAYAEVALIYARLGLTEKARNAIRKSRKHQEKIRIIETEAVLMETEACLLRRQTGPEGIKNPRKAQKCAAILRELSALRKRMGLPQANSAKCCRFDGDLQ